MAGPARKGTEKNSVRVMPRLEEATDMGSHAERFLRGVGICSTAEEPRLAALTVATKAACN